MSGQTSLPLTSSAEDSRVKTCRWLEGVRAWMERGADCGTSSIVSLLRCAPGGASSKTFPAFCPATEDEILPSSFEGWKNWGICVSGGYLIRNTSESPNAAVVCSLSDTLEPEVDSRYYLSPKACRGIIRRAEKRGKLLPPSLGAALEHRARQEPPVKQGSSHSNGSLEP